jgi:HEPN domain-containing protein
MSGPREQLALQWMAKAANDLKNAQHTLLLPDPECPLDTVCFHAQQCAEKSLKAFLTLHGVPFEKIHELGQLLELCTMSPGLIRELSRIDGLTPYATEARYPDEEGQEPISRRKAEQAVALGKQAYEAIQKRLND